MRTGKVMIRGKEYITCFSTRVLMALEERGGNSDEELKKIMENRKVTDLFWLLAQMIDAGDRYARLEGLENPGKLTLDELVDSVGVDEYPQMFGMVVDAVKAGNTPKVEVKPSKNVKAAPEE